MAKTTPVTVTQYWPTDNWAPLRRLLSPSMPMVLQVATITSVSQLLHTRNIIVWHTQRQGTFKRKSIDGKWYSRQADQLHCLLCWSIASCVGPLMPKTVALFLARLHCVAASKIKSV